MPEPNTDSKTQHQAGALANRVSKRFKHLRKRFARQRIDVFRLYDGDIPDIRVAVDWYGGHLVLAEYVRRQSAPGWLARMGEAVAAALEVPAAKVHLKQRRVGRQDGKRYQRIAFTDDKIIMNERDLKFYVNLNDYVDTGLFADHRETRRMVRDMAAGRDFLNLFCYTGSFTCYAAKGGARTSVSVDRSQTALDRLGENLALNNLTDTGHMSVRAPAFEFLANAHQTGLTFDLAVVDPPSFSTSRTEARDFDIARDHPLLLKAVLRVMRTGATVFFSTNHQGFDFDATGLPAAGIEEITTRTIPEDYRNKHKRIHRCWQLIV